MKIKTDRADTVFSQYVRLRDEHCLRCLSPVQINDKGLPVSHQASHFMGRAKEGTRYEPDNVCCLCHGCHMYFTANPAEHFIWQVKRLGQGRVDQLVIQANTYCKKDRKKSLIVAQMLLKTVYNKNI